MPTLPSPHTVDRAASSRAARSLGAPFPRMRFVRLPPIAALSGGRWQRAVATLAPQSSASLPPAKSIIRSSLGRSGRPIAACRRLAITGGRWLAGGLGAAAVTGPRSRVAPRR